MKYFYAFFLSLTPLVFFGQNNIFNGGQGDGFDSQNFIQPDIPLPIEWSYFSGTYNDEGILLEWETLTENQNKGFHILRRTEVEEIFSKIAWVNGTGSSAEAVNYQFTDRNVMRGMTNYYMLEQVDFDGTINRSNVISVNIPVISESISLVPNPVKENFEINILSPIAQSGQIRIYDISGKILFQETLFLIKGMNRFPQNLGGFPKGAYFMQLTTSDGIVTLKFFHL